MSQNPSRWYMALQLNVYPSKHSPMTTPCLRSLSKALHVTFLTAVYIIVVNKSIFTKYTLHSNLSGRRLTVDQYKRHTANNSSLFNFALG